MVVYSLYRSLKALSKIRVTRHHHLLLLLVEKKVRLWGRRRADVEILQGVVAILAVASLSQREEAIREMKLLATVTRKKREMER